jgi:hypothetical protein
VKSALEETQGGIVARSGESRGDWSGRGTAETGLETSGTKVYTGGSGRVESTIWWKPKTGGGAGDGEVSVKGAAVEGVGAEGDNRIQVAEHG